MLADRPIHTALPATDLERARRFYAEKLGLTPETELPDMRDGLWYSTSFRKSSVLLRFIAFHCTITALFLLCENSYLSTFSTQ
jgi:catechol 2,3-dioxygenase-like lactoylglutathione lyase family enzyme